MAVAKIWHLACLPGLRLGRSVDDCWYAILVVGRAYMDIGLAS